MNFVYTGNLFSAIKTMFMFWCSMMPQRITGPAEKKFLVWHDMNSIVITQNVCASKICDLLKCIWSWKIKLLQWDSLQISFPHIFPPLGRTFWLISIIDFTFSSSSCKSPVTKLGIAIVWSILHLVAVRPNLFDTVQYSCLISPFYQTVWYFICKVVGSVPLQSAFSQYLLFVKLINSQSLEDTQVGYISQKYILEKFTLEK